MVLLNFIKNIITNNKNNATYISQCINVLISDHNASLKDILDLLPTIIYGATNGLNAHIETMDNGKIRVSLNKTYVTHDNGRDIYLM